jgi:hypothetical protein
MLSGRIWARIALLGRSWAETMLLGQTRPAAEGAGLSLGGLGRICGWLVRQGGRRERWAWGRRRPVLLEQGDPRRRRCSPGRSGTVGGGGSSDERRGDRVRSDLGLGDVGSRPKTGTRQTRGDSAKVAWIEGRARAEELCYGRWRTPTGAHEGALLRGTSERRPRRAAGPRSNGIGVEGVDPGGGWWGHRR